MSVLADQSGAKRSKHSDFNTTLVSVLEETLAPIPSPIDFNTTLVSVLAFKNEDGSDRQRYFNTTLVSVLACFCVA